MLVMSASAMSGARWVLMQKMVARQDLGITTPLASLVMLMPVMAVTVLVASIVIERPWSAFGGSWYTSSMSNFVETLLLVGVGAVLAFIMTSAEFKLVCDTSAVTVTVAGVCKEVRAVARPSAHRRAGMVWPRARAHPDVPTHVLPRASFQSSRRSSP